MNNRNKEESHLRCTNPFKISSSCNWHNSNAKSTNHDEIVANFKMSGTMNKSRVHVNSRHYFLERWHEQPGLLKWKKYIQLLLVQANLVAKVVPAWLWINSRKFSNSVNLGLQITAYLQNNHFGKVAMQWRQKYAAKPIWEWIVLLSIDTMHGVME